MRTSEPGLYLSTLQAAEALGVSVSTVKRWVDEGILAAQKTSGGHRKLSRAEILALGRQGNLPRGDLAAATLASPRDRKADPDQTAAALLDALLRGQGTEVRSIVRRAYASGMAVETLADRVIAPVMAKVGHDWQTERIDVWQEHRATQLCAAALYELKDELEARAERSRPIAVGGAPQGDPYLLSTLLAQLVLLDAGWEAVNLGPNTPLPSMARALGELRPRLLWLSVSYLEDQGSFLDQYRNLYRMAEQQGVAVAVGGQALLESIRSTIPYTTHGDGLSYLAAFARTLHPRRKPPRRGRPPKHSPP
jgi:MerR family transcriptional regulator, light-induced transcriptional regulator